VGGQAVGEVGGQAAFGAGEGLAATRYDLFGMWLAAIPVVAIGAPLGALAAARLTDRQLVTFVAALAAAEVITTLVFVDGLRSDPVLVAYAIAGAALLVGALLVAARRRRQLLGVPGAPIDESLTRERLDIGPRFRQELERRRGERTR